MKVLAIIGTPTREAGYTTRTVATLETCLRKHCDIDFEYLHLEDAGLSRCQGHLTCVKLGESHCPFSAQIEPLFNKMQAADAVIFASPVHCFNVSTLMKNMIDLFVYQMHRPAFFGKKAIVVTAAAGAGQHGVLKYLKKTAATWGFDVVGKLGTHAGLFNEPAYQPKLDKAADQVARRLVTAVRRNKLPRPGLADLINFRVWRSVIYRSKDASPYDWNYWSESGWLEQDYYFPARINPLANSIAAFVERMIGRAIAKVSVKPIT